MKQTIQKPDASLSAGRRGTLNLPDFDKSFCNELRSGPLPKKKTEAMHDSGDEEAGDKKDKKFQAYPGFPYGVISLLTSLETSGSTT